jgi:uncharacterized protein YbaP (TraB family)
MNGQALAALLLAWAALLAGAGARAAGAPVVRDAITSLNQPPEPAPAPGAAAGVAPAAPSACPPEPVVPSADEAAAAMRSATDGGFLWKATRDGRTSWLYGTIHVAQREWMFPGPRVMKAILASDVVALELDPTDPEIMRRLQRVIVRRPGSPELPPELEARLQAQMAAACIAPASLAALRPEMRAVTLEVMSGRAQGLEPAYGVDAFIGGMAHGLKKPVRSLETPESQAALLVSDDPAETAHSVEQILDELEGGRGGRILERVAGDWHRGDLADMSAYADWCECMATPDQRADFARIVDDRNPPMADRIAQWHGEGRALFVAVGSLHMIGPSGLPALLRARGFVVERVDYAGVPKA